jgi:hypothetical protein
LSNIPHAFKEEELDTTVDFRSVAVIQGVKYLTGTGKLVYWQNCDSICVFETDSYGNRTRTNLNNTAQGILENTDTLYIIGGKVIET